MLPISPIESVSPLILHIPVSFFLSFFFFFFVFFFLPLLFLLPPPLLPPSLHTRYHYHFLSPPYQLHPINTTPTNFSYGRFFKLQIHITISLARKVSSSGGHSAGNLISCNVFQHL
ncbi:hypothetical protein OTU49_007964 [Cherax quadricarinatus]|uniref:Uncharacterized protein n=1 Tax=Cherax quadricarinatus TaxID=27406 RepID=A0AAW0WX81_CHEQU